MRPSYLNSLSRTCKELREVLQPILYRDLRLVIPRKWITVNYLEPLLGFEAQGLQRTLSFSLSMRADGFESGTSDDSSYDDDLVDDDDEYYGDKYDHFG